MQKRKINDGLDSEYYRKTIHIFLPIYSIGSNEKLRVIAAYFSKNMIEEVEIVLEQIRAIRGEEKFENSKKILKAKENRLGFTFRNLRRR